MKNINQKSQPSTSIYISREMRENLDKIAEKDSYHSRSALIREWLQEKIEEYEKNQS